MKSPAFVLIGLTAVSLASEPPNPATPPKGVSASDWSGIRAAYQAGRHAIHRESDGTFTARNPGQQWQTVFDGKGFTITPDHGAWSWGLELTGVGGRTHQPTRTTPKRDSSASYSSPAIRHEGGKVLHDRGDGLTEWFLNDVRGLEQGWTFKKRPARSDHSTPLRLELSVRGGLRPAVSADGASIYFRDGGGDTVLNYGGLKAWDATGRFLPVRFEPTADGSISIAVEDSGARYPVTVDPVAQQAYLKASAPGGSDEFGTSVAIWGDTVVVGARYEDSASTGVNGNPYNDSSIDSGAAYVFVRSGGTWSQQAYLKASNTGANDQFGISVAIAGDTVVVSSPFEDSAATGINGNQADNSANLSGSAYVFVRNGTTWSQQAYLKASNTGVNDQFGSSVTISGQTIAVGATGEASTATGVNGNQANNGASGAGAVYVFARSGTVWSQQAYIKPSNTGQLDAFGIAVALSDDTLVVGSQNEDSAATGVNGDEASDAVFQSGAAYVFVRGGTNWSQEAYLKASNTGQSDEFGTAVAISGNTVVVGAFREDSAATSVNGDQTNNSATSAGAAYVFLRDGGTWSQQAYLKASNTGLGDEFGISVAVSGDSIVVGARSEDSAAAGINGNQQDESAESSGAAYVFQRFGSTWIQQVYLKASNSGAGDVFGSSVAISGDTVFVGAYGEASSAAGVNGNESNNGALNSGASYIYAGVVPEPLPEIAIASAGGGEIPDGGTKGFGLVPVGDSKDITFMVSNSGEGELLFSHLILSGGDSDRFSIIQQPAATVGSGGGTTFVVRFTPDSESPKLAAIHVFNNDSDENPFDITVTGTGATAAVVFDSIAASSNLAGPNAEPDAIPFNDGVENLLKYAFNMNLAGPDNRALIPGTGNSGLPSIGLTGDGPATMIRVEFLRRRGSGLVYTPKRSSTLSPGSFVPIGGTSEVTSINDDWERVVVQEAADPATLPASFAVVEVVLPGL